MSTVSLPPGGAGGKIPYTRKGSIRTLSPVLTQSPRSSTCSTLRLSSPPSSGPSTGYDLGPVAESPVSDHGAFGSTNSLPFSRSACPDETAIPLANLPALPTSDAIEHGGCSALTEKNGNAPVIVKNVASRRDTDGGNVVTIGKEGLPIVAFAPIDLYAQKYKREVFYPSDPTRSKIEKIAARKRKFTRNIPPGWIAYECPEGKLYFYHEFLRLLTMTDIQDDSHRQLVEMAAVDLHGRLREMEDAPPDAEIVVMKTISGEHPVMAYYVASMSEQCVFWFEEVDVTYVTDGERAVVSEKHLEKAVKAQFWQHVELFPNHRGIPSDALCELRDTFTYGLCDYVTSQTSMFAYDPDTIEKLSKCMASMKEDEINPANTAAAARLLNTVYKERFLHFYGETGARLDRKDSAFKKDIRGPRSIVFMLISPFLFFMPFVYLKELERTYVDNSVHYYFWRQFIEGLKRDWENSITPATVLLSANVGFLAINSIDTDSPNKSAAQIASYISSILSLFIYIVAQILSRHHRHHANGQADQALQYILKREDRLIGLQGVAIAFSLPVALFLWSMLTFLVALMFVFFEDTSVATKIAMGVVTGFLGVTVLLLLYLESEGTITETEFPRVWSLLVEKIQAWRRKWLFKDSKTGDRWRLRERHARNDSLSSSATLASLPGP